MILAYQLCLTFIICLPCNALTENLRTSNLTSLTADGDYKCVDKPSIFTKTPAFKDCRTAINQLPRFDNVGSFHNGPPDDPYQLPLEKTVSTCTVSVEMQHQGSSREAFSWSLLVEATLRLSKECLGPVLSPERGAGVWIRFGNHRKIVVIVRYYKTLAERKHVATAWRSQSLTRQEALVRPLAFNVWYQA